MGLFLIGLGVAGLGCCKAAALSLDSTYDKRPFEVDGIDAASVPYSQFDSVLENLRRGWLLSTAAPTAVSVTVAAAPGGPVVVVNPSVPEWGAAPRSAAAAAAAAGSVMLSPQSHLVLSPEGLIEVKERCCLTKRRSLTFADRVKWVRVPMPSPCGCCSSLEMGTHAGEGRTIEAPMDSLYSSALMAALKPAMLARAPARGGTASSLTAIAPQWNCQCPKKTMTIDSDFATITTQPSVCSCSGTTTLFRTQDVPWVYSERSATLWCQGLTSLLIIGGLFAAGGILVSVAPQSNVGLLALLVAPFTVALFSCLGIISLSAIASLCCTFTVVTLGTPGSAASDDNGGVRPTNVPLLLCCCVCCMPCALLLLLRPVLCSRASVTKVYNCEAQGAAQSKAFVAAVKRSIGAAHLASRRAAAAGSPKEDAQVAVVLPALEVEAERKESFNPYAAAGVQ